MKQFACSSQEEVDTVADDFNGVPERSPDLQFDSALEEPFKNAKLPVPPATTPLWRSGGIPSEWTDVCGFVKPPKSQSGWLIRKYGASEIIGRYLGLSSEDLTCHHEVWIHLSHVSAPLVERSREPRHRKRDLSRQPVKKRQELYLVREDVTVRAISPQEDTVGDKLRNKVSLVMRSVEHLLRELWCVWTTCFGWEPCFNQGHAVKPEKSLKLSTIICGEQALSLSGK